MARLLGLSLLQRRFPSHPELSFAGSLNRLMMRARVVGSRALGHRVFVSDSVFHRIQVFNLEDGSFLRAFGESQLRYPSTIAACAECIFAISVAQGKSHALRCVSFAPNGEVRASFTFPEITYCSRVHLGMLDGDLYLGLLFHIEVRSRKLLRCSSLQDTKIGTLLHFMWFRSRVRP
jgi:hypothetical protein